MTAKERIKRLREHMVLTQRELAEEFQVTPGAIALWETGEREIPGPILSLLRIYEEDSGLLTQAPKIVPSSPCSTRGIRTAQYSALAGSLAFDWLKYIFSRAIASDPHATSVRQNISIRMATKLALQLSKMKGLGAKTFQIMNQFDFLFSDEDKTAFGALQTPLTPMPQKMLAEIFREEFGTTPRQLFASWSATPIATASIGQVHVARLKTGEKVAVKLQYPKIVEALKADLKNVALIDKLMAFLLKSQEKGVVIGELSARILDECDYIKEAAYQEKFYQLYSGHKDIRIPKVFREYCTPRILVTEFIEGDSFEGFRAKASQTERDHAGAAIWNFTFESIFKHGIFHADPNPGNFLFRNGKVVVLDFGCVTHFDRKFTELWKQFFVALAKNDYPSFCRIVVDFGIAPRPENFDFEYQFRASRKAFRPWTEHRPTSISIEEIRASWKEYFIQSPNRARYNHSKEWVFLLRLTWGMPLLLASLGSRADWRSLGLSSFGAEPPIQELALTL